MVIQKLKEDLPQNIMKIEPNITRLNYKRAILRANTSNFADLLRSYGSAQSKLEAPKHKDRTS